MTRRHLLRTAPALLALALAGCAQSTAQADYIGTDAAKAIALEAAGIGEADATFTTAELETRNNTPYYEVDFTAGGQEYDYDIDALTGTVIAGNQQAAGSTGSHDGSTGDTAITADKAKEIALNHAGLTADQVTFVRSNLDQDDGRTCYDVEFYTADYTEYDYEIDANTGDVLSYDYDAEGYQDRARAAAPPPSPPTGPRRSPWPRSPAPPPATSTSLRPTGTTAAWSTRGPSTTTAPSTTSPSTATAAPSGAGTWSATDDLRHNNRPNG